MLWVKQVLLCELEIRCRHRVGEGLAWGCCPLRHNYFASFMCYTLGKLGWVPHMASHIPLSWTDHATSFQAVLGRMAWLASVFGCNRLSYLPFTPLYPQNCSMPWYLSQSPLALEPFLVLAAYLSVGRANRLEAQRSQLGFNVFANLLHNARSAQIKNTHHMLASATPAVIPSVLPVMIWVETYFQPEK